MFNHIEASSKGTASEKDFEGLFDDIDVTSNKLGATVAEKNKKLVALLDGIGDIKLGDFQVYSYVVQRQHQRMTTI